MCWIFLFPVAVISMIVLLMYENDRHTLKRNMARGRCGLPGMPNRKFFQKDETECEAEQEKEPFEKEMKVLKTDIHGHRKKIEETKERVENADKQLITIDATATGMKKKYDMIMHLLKEDILDAEEEYTLLNKKMASANELRQKFYSLENECEGINPNNPAANCDENSFSRRSSNGKSKHQNKKRLSSCCAQSSYDQKSTDNSSDSGIIPSNETPGMNPSFNTPGMVSSYSSGMRPFNTSGMNSSYNPPGMISPYNASGMNSSYNPSRMNSYTPPGMNSSYNPSGMNSSFNTPGMISSNNAPGMNSFTTPGMSTTSNIPTDPCNKYPRPPCCPPPKPAPPPPPPPNPCHPPIKRPRRKDDCERPGVPFCCKYPAAPDYGFPPQKCPESHKNWQQQSLDSNSSYNNDSLSSSLAVRKTSTSARNSSSVMNRGGTNNFYSSFSNNKDTTSTQENDVDTFSRNSNKDKSKNGSRSSRDGSPPRNSGSCCSSKDPSPQRGIMGTDYGRQSNDGRPGAERSSCCSGSGKPDPCAPPTYCPGRSACACCKCEPPVPRCPPSQLVKMPPYSTFFDERMPVKPCTTVKQTIYSGAIGDDESDNISYDTQVVTEVTSTCTFPPKCCRSVYEDFVNKRNVTEPPNVKLPVFIDPCDPCAEIPREISPFEDVVNISHTCGTQTNGDLKDEKCCSSYPLRKSRIIP